jgi:hypothetical protein
MLSLGNYLHTKLHALLAILKRLVWEDLSLTLPVGLLPFHLASEVEKVE